MTSQLAPILQAAPFIGVDANGRPVKMHPNFIRWWNSEVVLRMGGSVASTNIELEQQITTSDEQIGVLEAEVTALQNSVEAGPPQSPVVFPDADEPVGMADLRSRLATLEKLVAQLSAGPP